MIEQISALLEESHLIAYATAIKQHTGKETGKCRNENAKAAATLRIKTNCIGAAK